MKRANNIQMCSVWFASRPSMYNMETQLGETVPTARRFGGLERRILHVLPGSGIC